MDDLVSRLRDLSKNKYFAYCAVIFFAFIIALMAAILAYRPDNSASSSPEDVRAQIDRELNKSSSINSKSLNRSPLSQIGDFFSNIGKNKNDTSTGSSKDGTSQNSGQTTTKISQADIIAEKIIKSAKPLPEITVNEYTLNTTLPSTPGKVTIHQVKTNYTDQEVETFASKFGFLPFSDSNIAKELGSEVLAVYDLKNQLYVSFDKRTGAYRFFSLNGISGVDSSPDPESIALTYVQSLDFYHPCIEPTTVYSRKSDPNSTYVEIRCNWNAYGGALLNPLGILNYPEDQPLSKAKLGELDKNVPENSDVYDNTDNSTFRATDFNTITVRIDKSTSKIKEITSNIPQVLTTEDINSAKVIPAQTALNALRANNTSFGLASPVGTGFIDLDKVYFQNEARAEKAKINDFILAYQAIPGIAQDYDCPVWMTRSFGKVESGYDSMFVQTLKAVDDPRCTDPEVLGAQTIAQLSRPQNTSGNPGSIISGAPGVSERPEEQTSSLKYKDFTFEATTPQADSDCPPDLRNSFTNSYIITSSTYLTWRDVSSTKQARSWYVAYLDPNQLTGNVLSSQNGTLQIDPSKKDQYEKTRRKVAVDCKRTKTTMCPLSDEIRRQIIACPFLTTMSPRIYGYSDQPKDVTVAINPYGGIGYNFPRFDSNIDSTTSTWSITLKNSAMYTTTSYEVSSLHYEYRHNAIKEALLNNPVDLSSGWIIPTSNLNTKIDQIAGQLNLNPEQLVDLKADISRERTALNKKYVFITLLDSQTINSVFNARIQPQPDNFYRYFFYLKSEDSLRRITAPTEPEVVPVHASPFYFVETGVFVAY